MCFVDSQERRNAMHHGWMKGIPAFPVLIFLLFSTPALADFAKGLDAVMRGDYATAKKQFKPLAERGMVDAQFNMGWMHDYGKGVKQSDKTAAKWYQLAAEQGHVGSQYNLALMYQKGKGVTRDYKVAINLYKKAVAQGHTKAHYNLAKMYVDGYGVSQNYRVANKWFNLAAEQGDIYAPSYLGYMYEQGYGVIQDYRLAHMWLSISASQGNKKALVDRNMLEFKMIPADIAKATELARECIAKNYKGC